MKYLFFYCDVEWELFNRREFILEMSEVLPDWEVVAINRPSSLVPNVFRKKKVMDVFDTFFRPRVQNIGSVKLVRPFTLFHDHIGGKLLEGRGNWLQKIFIEFSLKRVGITPTLNDEVVIWLYEQPQWQFAKLFSRTKKNIVWEIFDDYRLTAQGRRRKMWIDCESNMLSNVDHILTLTESIKAKYTGLHNQVSVMGNGYPSGLFYPRTDVPKELQLVSGKVVMYLGVIRDWIDFELLKSLVLVNKELNFVFVGPVVANVRSEIDNLSQQNNFFYLGAKKRQEVPEYMSAADVAIVPYIKNKFTASVKPIKLFEFLACGVPVVTTTNADLRSVKGAVYIAKNNDFQYALDAAICEADKGCCIKLAAPWSWNSVAMRVKLDLGL